MKFLRNMEDGAVHEAEELRSDVVREVEHNEVALDQDQKNKEQRLKHEPEVLRQVIDDVGGIFDSQTFLWKKHSETFDGAPRPLKEIQEQEHSLGAEAEQAIALANNFLRVAQTEFGTLQNREFRTDEEIQFYHEHLHTVAQAMQEVGKAFRILEGLDQDLSLLAKEEGACLLQSVEGVSPDNLEEEQQKRSDEIKRLQQSSFGLGSFFQRDNIRVLNQEIRTIQSAREKQKTDRPDALFDVRHLTQKFSEVKVNFGNVVFDRIVGRYREFLREQGASTEHQAQPLTPEELQVLDEQFIEHVVRPFLEKEKAVVGFPIVKPQEIEHAVMLIREIERSGSPLRSASEDSDKQREKNEQYQQLLSQVRELPYGLQVRAEQFITSAGGRPLASRFQEVASWAEQERSLQSRQKIDDTYIEVFNNLWRAIPQGRTLMPESMMQRRIAEVNTELHTNKTTRADFLKNVDIQCFATYFDSQVADDRYSESERESIRRSLGEALALQLKETREGTDASYRHGSRLMKLHQKELAPIAILNAFRDNGASGNNPFISIHVPPEKTELVQYMIDLTKEEEEAIATSPIPGVAEIVGLIKENPALYRDHSIRQNDGSYVRNPIRQEIEAHVATAGHALLNSDLWQDKFFALDLLKNVESDISESYPAILQMLRTDQRPEIQAMVDQFFSVRIRHDVNFATFVLENSRTQKSEKSKLEQLERNISLSSIMKASELPPRTIRVLSEYFLCPQEEWQKFFNRRSSLSEDVKKFFESDDFNNYLITHPEQASILLQFDEHAPLLVKKDYVGTTKFILTEAQGLIDRVEDVRFLNTLVGRYSKIADSIIRDYDRCLKAGVVKNNEHELVLEVADEFRVLSPEVFKGYREAKASGSPEVFVAGIRAMTEKMTGKVALTEEERQRPEYQELVHVVYANNAGNWGTFEGAAHCEDRTADIEHYERDPIYVIDLLSGAEVKLKEGEVQNSDALQKLQEPILVLAERAGQQGYNPEILQNDVSERINVLFAEAVDGGSFPGLDRAAVQSTEDKLTLLLADSQYGAKSIVSSELKNVFIAYEFAKYEDVRDYVAGTTDRVSRASNREYALLCELNTFFTDRVKEVNRRLIQEGWENPVIAAYMEQQFHTLSQRRQKEDREGKVTRQNVLKLGVNEGFLQQMRRALRAQGGKDYSPAQVRRLVRRYETLTSGLTAEKSSSQKERTRSFYGQLRSQRERTRNVLQEITGQDLVPADAHLENVDIRELLEMDQATKTGEYDPEKFAAYTAQRFIDVFRGEREILRDELDKYVSSSGHERTVLNGYFTKTKESAYARMVGGVCVAKDNPDSRGRKNIWDMQNYFQLVLQDPETNRCQGLVLLHHFEDQGKKILTASFNPSSTYTYSVDEAALFRGLAATLETFAQKNEFDALAVSKNKAIRTNRTGGTFERAMDERVTAVGKSFSLTDPQPFSHHPEYNVQDLDVIWERPDTQESA